MDKDQAEEFKILYDPLHKSLDRYCRMISGNRLDGEDLLHDTVLLTLKHFHQINNKQAMQSYMFTIASNLNKRRFKNRKPEVAWDEEELTKVFDKKISPDVVTEVQLIHEKILELPVRTSQTLMLFYVADLKLEEIREMQGGSLSGVKLRLKRGREQLKAILSEDLHQTFTMIFF